MKSDLLKYAEKNACVTVPAGKHEKGCLGDVVKFDTGPTTYFECLKCGASGFSYMKTSRARPVKTARAA